MRPKNFPARKLARQLRANGEIIKYHNDSFTCEFNESQGLLEHARNQRTKKHRGSR